jgi:ferric-dicitrate binding protein FerR (iron transport regulator)
MSLNGLEEFAWEGSQQGEDASYQRAAGLVKAGVEPALSPPQSPLEDTETPKKSPQSRKSSRRRALQMAAACIAVAFAAAAAWAWRVADSRGTNTERKPVLSQVSAALTGLASQVCQGLAPAVPTAAQFLAATPASEPRPKP